MGGTYFFLCHEYHIFIKFIVYPEPPNVSTDNLPFIKDFKNSLPSAGSSTLPWGYLSHKERDLHLVVIHSCQEGTLNLIRQRQLLLPLLLSFQGTLRTVKLVIY